MFPLPRVDEVDQDSYVSDVRDKLAEIVHLGRENLNYSAVCQKRNYGPDHFSSNFYKNYCICKPEIQHEAHSVTNECHNFFSDIQQNNLNFPFPNEQSLQAHSDQGKNFENSLFSEICKLFEKSQENQNNFI
jgi:hypothetical protein